MAQGLVAVWTFAVMASDWRLRRVPNALCAGGLAAALACWLLTGSGPLGAGWRSAAVVGLFASLPLLAAYGAGWIGGGDLKFLALLPLLGGARIGVVAFVLGGLLAGMWAGALLLRRRSQGGARPGRAIPLSIPYGFAFLWAIASSASAVP